jgi:hypothetical protein
VLTPPTTLIAPLATPPIPQNDASTGCTFALHRGQGFHTTFTWKGAQASAGIAGYELQVLSPAQAVAPGFDMVVGNPYSWRECNAFVPDSLLTGWQWRVRTEDTRGDFSDWSPMQAFSFSPCRVATGACR